MYRLYRQYNKKYACSRYGTGNDVRGKDIRAMSWKGVFLCTLAFLVSRAVWVIISRDEGGRFFTSAAALFYFADSLYIDYIFCKYQYFGKYQNIDEQARAGDWMSCLYVADSFLVLVGSIYAIFLSAASWHALSVRRGALALLCIALFLVLPVFETASKKSTLLWCILRVVLYGTAQRTGYLAVLFIFL